MKQLKQQYFRPVLPLFREHRAGLLACLGCLCLLFSALPLAAADRFVSFSNGDFLLNEGGKVGIFVDETDQKGISLAAHNLAEDLKKVCGAQVVFTEAAAENGRNLYCNASENN